jgi:glutathione S-transferase
METPDLVLHGFKLSGHTHRAQLFLSILGLPFEKVEVDLTKGAHKTQEFLARNPLGQVPVLSDGNLNVADSSAILVYLALKYDMSGKWYPRDPVIASRIQRWLSIAAGELQAGPGSARLAVVFGAKLDHDKAKDAAKRLFDVLERHLGASRYLASHDAPTIADIALYSYAALAPEGHVSLEPWPNVRAWLERIEQLDGFVPMLRTKVA